MRDNLNETGPAKATAAGRILVTTAANTIVERVVTSATVTTSNTTTSTTYIDPGTPGPAVTLTTGAQALAFWNVQMANDTGGSASQVGVAVSGATTIAAVDSVDAYVNNTTQIRVGVSQLFSSAAGNALTAGSNTFTMKYKVTGGNGTFLDRHIIVVGL